MKYKIKLIILFFAIIFACCPFYGNAIKAKNIEAPTNYANDTAMLYEEVKDGVVMITTILDDSMGAGTGMVYKESDTHLYIITNYHVIQDGVEFYCDFNSHERKSASVIGYDEHTDIAVLTCEKPTKYKVLSYANSNLNKEGEEVIAIGNPKSPDLTFTTTKGIIAKTNVIMSYGDFYCDRHLTMLDLALNPGNSGGPSFNVYGQVIGINSIKYTSDGSIYYEGLNFMIPISDALNVVNRIENHKYHVFVRPFFGNAKFIDVNSLFYYDKVRNNVPLDLVSGVIINSIDDEENNPLIEAGLGKNCLITKFAGQEVIDQVALRRILYSLNVYQKVDIEYIDLNSNAEVKIGRVAINALVLK